MSNPWMKFYPSDWRADQTLRICSLAARGLWIECMCIMHEAEPYGHLTIKGKPVTNAQLSMLVGIDQASVAELLTELEEAGVFSKNRAGVVYSRRMTRDEKKRKDGESAAKKGTLPNSRRSKQVLEKKEGNLPPPGVICEPPPGVICEPPSTQKPEARSQKEEREDRDKSLSSAPNGSGKRLSGHPDFDEWYRQYPKKRDPQDAAKAYAAARKKGASRDELLNATMRYAAECSANGTDQKFIKHPATWLNKGSWHNEPDLMTPVTPTNGKHYVANHSARTYEQHTLTRRSALVDDGFVDLDDFRARAH